MPPFPAPKHDRGMGKIAYKSPIEGLRVSVARAIHRVAAVEHEQAADYGQAQQEVARELEIIRQHPRDGIFWESITRESEAYLKELREQEQAPARP